MASPYNLTTGADGKFQHISTEYTVIKKEIDFSKVNLDITPIGPVSGAATANVLTLPAGFLCLSVIAKVKTASAAAKTVDIVDSGSKLWIDNLDTATVATTINASSFDDGRKVYSTQGTMNVVFPASGFPTTGTLELTVVGFQL